MLPWQRFSTPTKAKFVDLGLGSIIAAITAVLFFSPSFAQENSKAAPPGEAQSLRVRTFAGSNQVRIIIRVGEKVINGTPADARDWPGIATLRLYNSQTKESVHFCGGTVISQRWVLTAAHCVSDLPTIRSLLPGADKLQVVLNASDLLADSVAIYDVDESSIRIPSEYIADVEQARRANDEDMQVFARGDIALVKLTKDYDGPLSSLAASDGFENARAIDQVLVAGFGATHPSGSDLQEYRRRDNTKISVSSSRLMEAPLTLVPKRACQASYPKANISDLQLCAGGVPGNSQKDSCNGDSGGPLVATTMGERRVVQIGVVSFGPTPCASASNPIGVYSRVAGYVSWVTEVLGAGPGHDSATK